MTETREKMGASYRAAAGKDLGCVGCFHAEVARFGTEAKIMWVKCCVELPKARVNPWGMCDLFSEDAHD